MISQDPLDGFEEVRVERQGVSERFLLSIEKHGDTIILLQMLKHLHRPDNNHFRTITTTVTTTAAAAAAATTIAVT